MPANKQFYATMWAAAIDRGLPPKRAEVVAEAATTKHLYPDISYDTSLEADIKSLFEWRLQTNLLHNPHTPYHM